MRRRGSRRLREEDHGLQVGELCVEDVVVDEVVAEVVDEPAAKDES